MPETPNINQFIKAVEKRGLTWDKAKRIERRGLLKKITIPVIRVFIAPGRYYWFSVDDIERSSSYAASFLGYPELLLKVDEDLDKIRAQQAYDALPDTGNRK